MTTTKRCLLGIKGERYNQLKASLFHFLSFTLHWLSCNDMVKCWERTYAIANYCTQ